MFSTSPELCLYTIL